MYKYHVRFTPHDLSGYEFAWLEKYTRVLLFEEHLDKKGKEVPKHYHIYIESDNAKKSITDDIKSSLKIPPSGRGKNNKYYSCIPDWEDPGYIAKWGNEKLTRGFSEKEIMECVVSGKQKYLSQSEKRSDLSGDCVAPADESPVKKTKSISFQQKVLTIAGDKWYEYKKQHPEVVIPGVICNDAKNILVGFVCSAMREVSRGINPFLVRDMVYAILYDDLEFREVILRKIISKADL